MFMLLTVTLSFLSLNYVQANKQAEFELGDIAITVDEENQLLRYDIIINNMTDELIRSEKGFTVVVEPNKKLLSLMKQDSTAQMITRSTGGPGFFNSNSEQSFRVEYVIKDGVSAEQLYPVTIEGELLLLDGERILLKTSLSK